MRPCWLIVVAALSWPHLAAAAPSLGPSGPIELVDDAGRTVTVSVLPRRVISLAPSVTELLFALGMADEVVAVTQACNYPPAALVKPRLGFAGSAVEQIIMLEPELVVGMVGMVKPLTIETLDRRGIPLLLLEAKTLGDVYRHIRLIARIAGRLADADRLITHLEAQREALSARLGDVPPVPVLYLINDQPVVTVGPETFIHALIELAGGRNIAVGAKGRYPQFSLEEILMADPAVILFDGVGEEQLPQRRRRPWQQWPQLRAVAEGRLLPINGDLVSRPGPRIYEAAWQLAMVLHPERFAQEAPGK